MRASFSSRDVDNHTAFIRIKTNAPSEDQFIILPVEVEVTSGVLFYFFLCLTDVFKQKKSSANIFNAECGRSDHIFLFFFFSFCSPGHLLLHRDA